MIYKNKFVCLWDSCFRDAETPNKFTPFAVVKVLEN